MLQFRIFVHYWDQVYDPSPWKFPVLGAASSREPIGPF
jgi:hypothetical protein